MTEVQKNMQINMQENILIKPELPVKILPIEKWSLTIAGISLFNSATMYLNRNNLNTTLERFAYNYELFVFSKTGGVAIIDGKEYPISRGDIRFHRPGQTVSTILDYECYSCKFSFENNDLTLQQFQPLYKNEYLDSIPPFLSAAYPERYYEVFNTMLNAYINPDRGTPILLKAKLMELLYLLYGDACRYYDFGKVNHNISDVISKAMAFIENNYSKPLDLSAISKSVNLSSSHFHRIFTRTVTMTPLEYLTKTRIEQAKMLLITTSKSVAEIAEQCGFDSTSYFTSVFKKKIGQTPFAFRNRKLLENINY